MDQFTSLPIWWRLVRFTSDLALTCVALFSASVLRPFLPFGQEISLELTLLSPLIYALVVLIWAGIFLLASVYTPRTLRAIDEAQLVIAAATLATLTLAGVLYFTVRDISRLEILTFYLFDLLLLVGYRSALRLYLKLRNRPPYPRRRVLVIEADGAGRDVMHMIERYRWAGLEPVGLLDCALPPATQGTDLPVQGGLEQVTQCVQSEGINEVVVALPLREYDRFFQLIAELQQLPVRIRIVPDYFKTTLFRTTVNEFAGMPMITLQQPTLDPFERQVKRGFDLVVGSLVLFVCLPLMAMIALAIRLDSPGPVLFRQQRVGEGGRLFFMFKFRSMIQGADKQERVRCVQDRQLLEKEPDDPRVTRVGRLLRRTSLDELPQLVNVFRGEMSLVGPRPELPWLVQQYEPWQRQRLAVPQGITGWWQVNGRSDQPMYLHTDEDMFYIQNYSLLLDLQILWRTVASVLKGRGAY